MLWTKRKRELQSFLGIENYLSKFSPMTMEVCEPVQRLTSVVTEWTWNRTYQEIYERAKSLVKEDICMKYFPIRKPLYMETDALGVCLGVALLQVRNNLNFRYDEVLDNTMLWPISFARKSLSSTEQLYSNTGREAFWILHGLEMLHHYCFLYEAHVITDHYCFACEVHIITDHKPVVVIMGKDVAKLSQYL